MSLLSNAMAIPQIGGYNLTDSLRFRSSASAYLSRTPASAGNRQIFTYSAWVKRGSLGSRQAILDAYASSAGHVLEFQTANTIYFYSWGTGSSTALLNTTQVFRDISAWYHIILSVDTTQATASNRLKMYVNGVQVTSFATATYPSQNASLYINNNIVHDIGRRGDNQYYFDGYLTEVNFVDGQALTPSDFGEYNEDTGVWQPKKYTGTYGTNGFYLKGRGTDNSGNGNNWTENNFNTTNSALTTYDIMKDVPTLTNQDTANFATMNPLAGSTLPSFSNANLKVTGGGANAGVFQASYSTIGMTSGKWYAEFTWLASGSNASILGISSYVYPRASSNQNGSINGSTLINLDNSTATSRAVFENGTALTGGDASLSYSVNDIIGIAFDADSQTVNFYKNGSIIGSTYPYDVASVGDGIFYFVTHTRVNSGTSSFAANFGQRPFAYTPPTGFKKLNTFNLPDSTIVDGSQYMNTALWTGDDVPLASGGHPITGVGFSPDFVWFKSRGQATNHFQFDTIRGATNYLRSSTDFVEGIGTETLTSFDTDGFTVGNSTSFNQNPYKYVAWAWRASDSTAVSNTDGTNPSTVLVSANPTAGFSIVTYNPSSGGTVGHGLGTAPELIIDKKRDTAGDWIVQTTIIDGSNDYLRLNTTAAAATLGVAVPTATVYTPAVGSGSLGVSYCFTSVEGFSKIGTYTGNGSADGTFVYTGFRPAFVIIKQTDAVRNWMILDSTRDSYNQGSTSLQPNTANAETVSNERDYLSNGFKLRSTATNTNASGGTYIYMAFAENPFKNSLAR